MESHRPLQAITLDLDDTLWPVKPALIHARQWLPDWLAEHAPPTPGWLPPENRRGVREALLAEHPQRAHDVSFVRSELLRRSLRAAGEDPALAEPAFEVFLAARQRVTLYADVVPVLQRWSQRYRLVAVSNGNADVERIGIGRFFSASVSAHALGVAKPDPRIYLMACEALGVSAAASVYLDDLGINLKPAALLGMKTIKVTSAAQALAELEQAVGFPVA